MEQAVRYSVQERIKIVEVYFATKSVVQTQRQFRRDFPGRNAPTRLTIRRLLDKFRETGSVQDNTEALRRKRGVDMDTVIYQQGGATPNCSDASLEHLHRYFPEDRLISRRMDHP
ncbi:hypothetical protein O3P69_011893 [Scylla paramamosain]|uniref:DUF4817 domain-containing protein n=1 Tax=Scylla paramamosain TaxID=85552 RepID=A0AAW0SBA1_SCYPA